MKLARPNLPTGTTPKMFFMRCVWFALWGGQFPFASTDTVTVEFLNGYYSFRCRPGGLAGQSGWRWADAGRLYDKDNSYSKDELVWIETANDIVTTGATDVDTGTLQYGSPGLWLCLQDSAPVSGTPTKYYVPREPWPVADDPTSESNHWMLIRGPTTCT